MPSPFPGMDPYLEAPALWPGVHQSVITYARDALQPLLLPDYYVELGERIYLEDVRQVIYSDAVIHRTTRRDSSRGTAVLEPDQPAILSIDARQREVFLEIRAAGSHEVVTVIEVVSPSNKLAGSHGRQEYREKQDQVLATAANLVEIDLLRGGAHTVLAPPGELLTLRRHDYVVSVSRASNRREVEVYGFGIRERLPRIGIPLRDPEEDVTLDLPAVFTRCYDNGAYLSRVDYRESPLPPLRTDDADWADELIRGAGLR